MEPITTFLFRVLVMAAVILSTIGSPIPEFVWVQCGETSCDIKEQYCYQGNTCYTCHKAVCNTPDFDGGALRQCYFYCQNLERSAQKIPTAVNATSNIAEHGHPVEEKKTGVRMEKYVLCLIVFSTFCLGATAMKLLTLLWNRRKSTRNAKPAFPVSPPQGKHSGNLDPGQSAKLLVSGGRQDAGD